MLPMKKLFLNLSPLKFFDDPGERHFPVILFLFILSSIAFINALNHPFMMDDKTLIFGDPLRYHPLEIFKHFLPSYQHGLSEIRDATLSAKYFRPWAHALPLAEYVLFGQRLFFYHAFNLLLLNLAAFLIYRLIAELFNDRRLAFLTAGLFTIHPINGVLVNYITAGALSLMLIFSVGSMICALKAYRSPRGDGEALALGLLAYANAMLCHETAIVLPCFLAIALAYVRPFEFKKFAGIMLPYAVLAGGYFYFRMHYASLKTTIIDSALAMNLSLADYLAAFTKLILWYAKALLTLQDIVLIKSQAIEASHAVLWLGGFALMTAGIVYGLIVSRRPAVRFGLLFLAMGFLPAAAACFFQSSAGLILEPHWLLIGSLGFFVLAAEMLNAGYGILRREWWTNAVIVMILACLAAGWNYNRLWSDQKTYAEHWSKISPSLDLPFFFLGDAFMEREQWPQARRAYVSALERSGRPFEYYYNLAGIILLGGGDLQQAKDLLLRALAVDPNSSRARVSLGMVYSALDGRDDLAEQSFKEALDFDPRSTEARTRLAQLYVGQGRISEAIEQYEAILIEAPRDQELPPAILKLYLQTPDKQKTASAAERFLKIFNDPRRLLEVAVLFAQSGDDRLAGPFFEKALQKAPRMKEIYLEAGKFLGNRNDFDGAIRIWEQGLQLYPQEKAFRELMDQAERLKNQMTAGGANP